MFISAGRPLAFAMILALAACTPKTPEQKAQEASRSAVAAMEAANAIPADAVSGLLSPAELEEARQGVLRGYREDAARVSIHYKVSGFHADDPETRRWMALAAATGSSQAINDYVDLLRLNGAPADCAEARALIAKAKTQYAREIATAKAKNLRDAKVEALEDIRDREGQMNAGACGASAP